MSLHGPKTPANTIRGLFFPVGGDPVSKEIPNTLKGIYDLLGCDCFDIVQLQRGAVLLCDEDGLSRNLEPNVLATAPGSHGTPIVGPAFIVGTDRERDFCSLSNVSFDIFRNLPRLGGA